MWFYLWICGCTWQYIILFLRFSKSIIIIYTLVLMAQTLLEGSRPRSLSLAHRFRRFIPIPPPTFSSLDYHLLLSDSLFGNANKMLQGVIIIIIVILSRSLVHHKNNKNLWRHTSAAVPSSTPEQVLLTESFIKMNLFFGRSISISLLLCAQQRNYLFLVLCCFGQKQYESSADISIPFVFMPPLLVVGGCRSSLSSLVYARQLTDKKKKLSK